MSKPYDAAAKELLETDPAAWAALLGAARPPELVSIIDSDLSTITAAADKVIRVADDVPWLLHIEFQSGRDASLPRRLLKYNALLQERHDSPVATVLILLGERADSPAYNGRLTVEPPLGPSWRFEYTVVRVWELPLELVLNGPLALLPLAPVSDIPKAAVPEVLDRVTERLRSESDSDRMTRLMVAVSLLLQLRYDAMLSLDYVKKHPELREFAVFQHFIEEGLNKGREQGIEQGREQGIEQGREQGREEGVRRSIVRVGTKKFGPPTAEQAATLAAIHDEPLLEALSEKLLDVDSWDAFLRDA